MAGQRPGASNDVCQSAIPGAHPIFLSIIGWRITVHLVFRFLSRIGMRLAAVLAAFAALATGPAVADWQITVTIKDGSGPHAFCLSTAESQSVLSGFVSTARSVPIVVPNERYTSKADDIRVIVTGKRGTVVLNADPASPRVTADMSRARPSETACSFENAMPVGEASTAMLAGLKEQAEESETANAISDPKSIRAYLQSVSESSERFYAKAEITGLIRGDRYTAAVEQIAKDQKAREERRKANEMLERIMAAIAMLAEEKKAEKARQDAASQRKQDDARIAFREAEAASARDSETEGSNLTPGPYPPQNCFGAVGEGCAPMSWSWEKMFPEGSSCAPTMRNNPYIVECLVNSGSWAHDECCIRNPEGKKCGRQEREPNKCSAEWDHAFNHTLGGLFSWKRTVSKQVYNSSGYINEPLYCAKPGQVVAPSEGAQVCCSGQATQSIVLHWSLPFLVDICQP